MSELGFGAESWLWAASRAACAGIHLRRCRQIFPLRIIHFLLRHNAGLALEDSIQARVLQVKSFVLRLIASQFVLRAGYLIAAFLISA